MATMTNTHRKTTSLVGLVWRLIWPRSERFRGTLRVLLYAMVVSVGLAFFAVRSAYGDVKEQAMVVGRKLSSMDDLIGTAQKLTLNGQEMSVASTVVDQPLEKVLDRFEQACRQAGNGLAEEFKALPADLQVALAKEHFGGDTDASKLGVMREQRKLEGLVACLVQDPQKPVRPTSERIMGFASSGDLGEVGLLRYAYARRTENGRTHVITAWTDGSFKLTSLIPPESGDAPGTDVANVWRPEGSVRLLTAEIDGAPHSVRLYDTKATPETVLRGYDREMTQLGWTTVPFVADEAPTTRAYSRSGVELMVVVAPNDGRTSISMIQTLQP